MKFNALGFLIGALALSSCSQDMGSSASLREGTLGPHDRSDGRPMNTLNVSRFPELTEEQRSQIATLDCNSSESNATFYFLRDLDTTSVGRATRTVLFRSLDPETGCFNIYAINYGRATDLTQNRVVCTVNSIYQYLSRSTLRRTEYNWALGGESGENPTCLNLPGGGIGRYLQTGLTN